MTDKKTRILQATLNVVSAYGFRRSSMDDIAMAAGVSRPAIYQLFKNRDDVFRSCVGFAIDQAFSVSEAAARDVEGRQARIRAYLTAFMVYSHRLLVAGPHGRELLEAKSRLAPEQAGVMMERLAKELNRLAGLGEEHRDGMILAQAAAGLKIATRDEAVLVEGLSVLVARFWPE
jgi:AcrR family transcriptional regulator